MLFDRPEAGRRTLLLQVELRQQANPDAQELAELARSAELVVATVATAKRDAPHPRWFIGSGKVDELKQMLAFHDADIVLVNHDLSPAQQRNLEQALECRLTVSYTHLTLPTSG